MDDGSASLGTGVGVPLLPSVFLGVFLDRRAAAGGPVGVSVRPTSVSGRCPGAEKDRRDPDRPDHG